MSQKTLLGVTQVLYPDTTRLGLPIRPGVVEQGSMGRQSVLAVPDGSCLGLTKPPVVHIEGFRILQSQARS